MGVALSRVSTLHMHSLASLASQLERRWVNVDRVREMAAMAPGGRMRRVRIQPARACARPAFAVLHGLPSVSSVASRTHPCAVGVWTFSLSRKGLAERTSARLVLRAPLACPMHRGPL
jgi:hypothetical protein